MTKVKSISIEGSEPTPIADKGIDEAQSRNTVANTDVVKVQDGNGVWHAIPFNKFIEVATPLVASIMNNLNLQGNIAKFLGLNSNGAPGVSSVADAAAVLGGGIIQRGEIQFIDYVYSTMGGDGTMLALIKYICANYARRSGTGTTFIVNMVLNTQGCAIIHLYAGTLSDGKPQYGSGIYYTLNSWMKFSIDGYNYSESNL